MSHPKVDGEVDDDFPPHLWDEAMGDLMKEAFESKMDASDPVELPVVSWHSQASNDITDQEHLFDPSVARYLGGDSPPFDVEQSLNFSDPSFAESLAEMNDLMPGPSEPPIVAADKVASAERLVEVVASSSSTTQPSLPPRRPVTRSTSRAASASEGETVIVAHRPRGKQFLPPKPPPPPPRQSTTKRASPKSRKRKSQQLPDQLDIVSDDDIRDADVLFGRGGRSNHHPGNKVYRQMILDNQPTYQALEREDKKAFSTKFVQDILDDGRRFIARDRDSGCWYIATKEKAREKAAQALREDHTPEGKLEKKLRFKTSKKSSKRR